MPAVASAVDVIWQNWGKITESSLDRWLFCYCNGEGWARTTETAMKVAAAVAVATGYGIDGNGNSGGSSNGSDWNSDSWASGLNVALIDCIMFMTQESRNPESSTLAIVVVFLISIVATVAIALLGATIESAL